MYKAESGARTFNGNEIKIVTEHTAVRFHPSNDVTSENVALMSETSYCRQFNVNLTSSDVTLLLGHPLLAGLLQRRSLCLSHGTPSLLPSRAVHARLLNRRFLKRRRARYREIPRIIHLPYVSRCFWEISRRFFRSRLQVLTLLLEKRRFHRGRTQPFFSASL